MLSYRHAFHAGNHADVLKHAVLVQLSRYLAQKEKPFWIIDTHAGAGAYALDSVHTSKLCEYKNGVFRLWARNDLPPLLADYLELVRRLNPDRRLQHYPGSPMLAWWTLRAQDRLRLFELHSKDVQLLQENFKTAKNQVIIAASDGFAGLKSLLPPTTRRALIVIDPSYEEKQDYDRVFHALKDALTRFSSGIYLLWYPQLTRLDAHELPQRLKRMANAAKIPWLHAALRVSQPAKDGFGMHGSGLFIINPPWTLHAQLTETLPYLAKLLAAGEGADTTFTLEQAD